MATRIIFTNLDVVPTVLLQCFVDSVSTLLLPYHKSANKFPLLNEFTVHSFSTFFLDFKDGGKPFRLPMTVPIRGGGGGGGGGGGEGERGGQIAIIYLSQFYRR